MPIKSLESYLFERKLVNTSSIEILQNATVGIDVEHYLSRIYTFKKEQFLAGIGGIPSSLKDYIQSDLQVFKEFNIKPIFIIPGLKIQLQTHDYKTNELSPQEHHLESTWNKLNAKNNLYSGGYNNLNNESFRLFTDPLPISSMINDLIRQFIDNKIDYMVSPYDSSFQLSYLYQNNLIDSIYGSTDLLLTNIDKFILGMEFQSKDFRFVDKAKILHELSLTERQFMDLSIMVGCNVQPVTFPNFPPLPKPNPIQPYPQLSYFKLGLDIIYQYNNFNGSNMGDLFGYVVSLNDPKLIELYLKGLSAIKYIPVLNIDGEAQLYSVEIAKLGIVNKIDVLSDGELKKFKELHQFQHQPNKQVDTNENDDDSNDEEKTGDDSEDLIKIPNDLHEIISQRLPPELYLYQSIGLVPLDILGGITQGKLNIRPPFESGLSDGYKKLISSSFYNKLADCQFNLITQLLARYYQVKKVRVDYWFKDEVVELNNRFTPPIYQQVNHLYHYSDKSSEEFDIAKFFINLKTSFKPNKEAIEGKVISTREDVVSTILLRALYLFEIIDNKTNELTKFGLIIQKFIKENQSKLNDAFIQEIILILLLVKSNSIKLNQNAPSFPSVPKYFKDSNSSSNNNANSGINLSEISVNNDELNKITLISRIFSVHKFNIHPINYQGPISRALLHFRSHVKFVQSNLINTMEVSLIDFIARQEHNNIKVKYTNKTDWYKLIKQIPFYKDVNNTLLGVIAEIYFEYAIKLKKFNEQKEEKLTKEKMISLTQDHLLNSVFQINNSSFNINVNGINSVKASQFANDLKQGLELWSLFIEAMKVANEIDKSLVSDVYLSEILETNEWLGEFVEL